MASEPGFQTSNFPYGLVPAYFSDNINVHAVVIWQLASLSTGCAKTGLFARVDNFLIVNQRNV